MYHAKRRIPAEQKEQIDNTIEQIVRLFTRHCWLICLDRLDDSEQRSMLHGLGRNPYGRVDNITSVVYVDYRTDLLAMFIHQCIHAIHPDMLERDVTILELVIIENMTAKQAVQLLRLMIDYSMHRLFSRQKPHQTALIKDIKKLFRSGNWLVCVDQLRGETDLSIVYDLGHNCYGFVDEGVRVLYVDFREDLLATFIHECLHAIYPDLSEAEVRTLECRAMAGLGARQAECLLSLMLQNLF